MLYRVTTAALIIVSAAVFVLCVRAAIGRTTHHEDRTPLSCDGKPMGHHVHRARVLIADAYALERWSDATPAKRDELAAYRDHKLCVLYRPERRDLARYRDRVERKFRRHRDEQRALSAFSDIDPPGAAWLAALRGCESGGNYSTNTGNGFYGAYQFTLSTWASVGGSGYPHLASPAEQDYRAAVLYRTGGPGHWPNCP